MDIRCIPVGPMGVNCYMLRDDMIRQALLIDPGAEGSRLASVLREEGLELSAILLTHGHFDHIGAVDHLLREFPGIPVYVHPLDVPMLRDPERNLSFMNPTPVTCAAKEIKPVHEGDVISVGMQRVTVLHTPGHSAGSVSYLWEGVLFSGDTLFLESIGRFDFGNYSDIMDSLERLLNLPGETPVYPGHGPQTTVGHEKRNNPYAR